MKPKHACVMPFHHMAIRPDGQIFPCCVFRPENVPEDLNVSHPDPFNHEYMKDLREKMRNDEYVDGCSLCYEEERVSARSMRTDLVAPWMSHFGLPTEAEGRGKVKKLTNIDLSLSNVCNNKCRMCNPDLSTQWYSDAKKLGWSIPKGVVKKNTIVEEYDLQDLRFIKLLGGEPMMEQERIIQILKKCNLDKLSLLVVTNTTLTPCDELADLMSQCEKVTIDFSIDSYGPLNDFLRKGSDWQTTVKNIEWYKERFRFLNVHSVVSIYNVNMMHELFDFCDDYELDHCYNLLDGPWWMCIKNLPKEISPWLHEYVDEQLQKRSVLHHKVLKLIKNEIDQEGDFGEFLRYDQKLNMIRGEHWMDKNPELWNRIEPLITPESYW